MRYDKAINLYQSLKEPNGMGGFEKVNILILTINGYATPTKIQTLYTNSMLVTKQTIKVFTKDAEPDNIHFKDIDLLEYDGTLYSVLYYADFGKVRMFEVEVNGHGEK